jgi:predicted Zn finger-like uncharacterized protein
MILTCPRCATRYLVDAHQLWTTGRTVQCDACGQRWRATGVGERPAAAREPEQAPKPVREPESAKAEVEQPVGDTEFPPVPGFAPLTSRAPIDSPPESALFVQTPRRPTSGADHGPPGLGRALAILFLLGIVVAILVLFQDVIVRAAPALAPIYSALGLTSLSPAGAGVHV